MTPDPQPAPPIVDILEPILKGILIDVIRAQTQANIYASKEAEKYKDPKNPLLRYFPVASPIIQSFVLSLRFLLTQAGQALNQATQAETQRLFNLVAAGVADAAEVLPDPAAMASEVAAAVQQELVSLLPHAPGQQSQLTALRIQESVHRQVVAALADMPQPVQQLARQVLSQEQPRTGQWAAALESQLGELTQQHLGKLAPVYDFRLLGAVDKELYCTITLNVDMRSFDFGFENDKEQP
jgi:hypothetical protein